MKPQHIVILGGGFAGLTAALKLRKLRGRVRVTIVDRTNHNLFQPLLYQVSNGTLSPNEIAIPFRQFIPKNCNLEAIIGAAQRIDRATKTVHLEDGSSLSYDKLLVCVGTKPAYFGHPEWEAHAPGLKNLNDALRIREKFFLSTEIASRI
ncbi:MAG: FAD-dependent oxidoreductase, partial [Bacteroidia bacterium]|nr:FAD-dependent oxidoreductase [Bacteroidia bacterium]